MKLLQPILYTAIAGLVFTSCKSISNLAVPQGSNTIVNITAKQAELSEEEINTWSHADLETDSILGMSVNKAYFFLSGKKATQIIVAVEDSGIDVEHEDLKEIVWTNPKEIPGNNIDDDKNGYIDDIHGWNFLGNASGTIVNQDQLEITRIVKSGMEKFGNKKASEIAEADKKEFEEYLKIKEEFDKVSESKKAEIKNLQNTFKRLSQIEEAFKAVKKAVVKETFTEEDIKAIVTEDTTLQAQIQDILNLISRGGSEESLVEYKNRLEEYIESQEKGKSYDLDFNARQTLGDDLNNINDKFYGNNNVIGSKDIESHGTHVAGIIAASRNNNKGVSGVANNVKIMAVRAVPDGDEHDKDVALGIRYAVDNGAKIINTSFGKAYSPNKQWVFDAIKYAAKKDVLIVNAAGNSGENIDIENTFPNDSQDLVTEISDNFLTVGASSLYYNESLPASFSNYGKINVDVFAPGVDIYATLPKDAYGLNSGTSMASPSAAGVAALVRSYYPQLTASQVKHILMNSGTKINFEVIKPGSRSKENPEGEKVPFSELSVSGRVVNAYNALKMADAMVNKK